MIREDVLIVLNERQTLKAERLAELVEELERRRLSVTRLAPEAEITAIIAERKPRVLILDYLIGDFTTAIEVLQELSRLPEPHAISTLIWTDERSLHAAVSAMKLGAKDYIELEPSRSVQKVAQRVVELLDAPQPVELRESAPRLDFSSLVYQAQSARSSRTTAKRLAAGGARCIAILASPGAGRTTLAQEIHAARHQAGVFESVDYDLFAGSLDRFFGSADGLTPGKLSSRATLALDHVDADQGELLERAAAWAQSDTAEDSQALLIAGTTSRETARAWRKLAKAEVIELPDLAERLDDFLPLAQLALGRIASVGSRKAAKPEFTITHELLSGLQALVWPGNIAQFLAVISEAALVKTGEEEPTQELLAIVQTAKARWERFAAVRPIPAAQPLQAARALIDAQGDFRIAAARLGSSVSAIRRALHSTDEQFLKTVLAGAAHHD